jgi:two-component system, OmpR family, sensor histidine kinase KdpD
MSTPDTRPNPDDLLVRVQAQEHQQTRGRLKIFLGYAAGVGKTFAMLEAAHQRRAEGVDVVIGYVETHGRAETEARAAGLEVMPRRTVEYRGTTLTEMDVDAVLARRPQLALVDEFAHTNAPGSRHPKRFHDVEELLAAGIDIYTTLNIQHLESLNDVVARITGVIVRETVPDRLLDTATEIELVDLPPDELLKRLKEGKVYVPQQAARAIEQFFRTGNLTALREMALRRAAERVDDQMRAYMQTRAIPGPWPANDRLLALVSPGALSDRLVRTARRLADELNAEWIALYVEAPGHASLPAGQREQVARVLQLAESLGAKAVTLPGQAVAATALAYARQHNVTKIIVGKPLRSRWQELLRGSVVEQLTHASGPIDVYVISGEGKAAPVAIPADWRPHLPYRRYLQSAGLVALATLLGFVLDPALSLEKWRLFWRLADLAGRPSSALREPLLQPTNLAMLYLVVVVLAALNWGRGPAILASVLSVLAFDLFFVTPYLTFAVADTQYVLTFVGLLLVGLTLSTLASRAREQAQAAQQRAAETAELYDLSRDLTGAADLPAVLRVLIAHMEQTFGRQAVVLLPGDDKHPALKPEAASAGLDLDENERAVADWVFRHGEMAGRNTNTLPAAKLRYLPLKTAQHVLGVLGVGGTAAADSLLTPEQRRLMEAFASQASLALERAQLAEAARQAQVLQATERLQTALLNSISHDLRTPLVSITGALSSLKDDGAYLDEVARSSMVQNAYGEAERLNRLVGNLLEMTRLEAGALKVRQQPADVQDLIGAALDQMGSRLNDRAVTVTVPPDAPLVPMDFVLLTSVLVNLLDNALKYSPPGSPIELRAHVASGHMEIEVADRGVGLPPEDLTRIFEKFYRVPQAGQSSGTGLGLSICRGIVEAHGGFIVAENRPGGGTSITLALPLAAEPAGSRGYA